MYESQMAVKRTVALFALFLVPIIWGSTFILVKWTISEIDLYYFLFLRFSVTTLFMIIIFHHQFFKASLFTIRDAFILSIFMGGAYISQTEGLRFTTASNSALITGLYLILIPVFLAVFYKKKIELLSILAVVISFFGLYLLAQYNFTEANIGDYITLITAVACAFHAIFTGEYTKKHGVMQLVIYQFLFIAVFCGVVTLMRESYTLEIPQIGYLTILITAVFATGLAFSIQTYAQRIIDPTRTGIILATEGAFGMLFGWWLGGDSFTTIAFIGALLTIIGVITSEIHPLAKYLKNKIVG